MPFVRDRIAVIKASTRASLGLNGLDTGAVSVTGHVVFALVAPAEKLIPVADVWTGAVPVLA